MQSNYLTIAERSRHEGEKIKGSRFVVTVAPASTAPEAEAIVAAVSEEFSDASHNCFAYRLGPSGDRTRSSDDGEPSGSAGRPILNQIEGQGVTDTVVVVTRYFGGTKLGVGGLVRAYGGAAAEALQRAERVNVEITVTAELTFPYECTAAVESWLHSSCVVPSASSYEDTVCLRVELPVTQSDTLLAELRERTGGRVRVG